MSPVTESELVFVPPHDDPRVAGWLVPGDNCTELGYEIVTRVYCDVGIVEDPEGSNWGGRIETMARRWGYDTPQYWCAIWVMTVLSDRGCLVPRWGGSCENWRVHVKQEWRMTVSQMLRAGKDAQKHMIGSVIFYEHPVKKRLVHTGIITRITKTRVFTAEGNRGYAGGVTNNGEWVGIEPCERHDVYGIYVPQRSPLYTPRRQTIMRAPVVVPTATVRAA